MSRRPPPGDYARRRARQKRRRAQRSRRTAVVLLLALGFLVVVALAAFGSSPSPLRSAVPASSSRLLPAGPPRPQVIALQGALRLQLPVSQRRVTAIGYHAAGEDALPLAPVGRQANEGLFSRIVHRIFGGGGAGITWYQLGGGQGPSTGAVDIGAPAGTDVYAPVAGTVVGIQVYVLDGRAFGNVIQIQPEGSPSAVVSVTHVAVDPSLTVGSPLIAAVSKLGTIVDFSGVERQVLAGHTQDAGNHVTLEVQPAVTAGLS